jgi:hypothetical protein
MSRVIFGLDPGTLQSAIVAIERLDSGAILVNEFCTLMNPEMLQFIRLIRRNDPRDAPTLVIEQIQSMGMAVGQEVFTTVWWAGRFYEAWPNANRYQLPRRPIKLHLCGTMQAKDSNVRQALLDKFGGATAIGRKASPGPLYGVKGHEFAALAVAVTWIETQPQAVASVAR